MRVTAASGAVNAGAATLARTAAATPEVEKWASTMASNVASMPMLAPLVTAAWNINSFGVSTGMVSKANRWLMAGPKVEQVTGMLCTSVAAP